YPIAPHLLRSFHHHELRTARLLADHHREDRAVAHVERDLARDLILAAGHLDFVIPGRNRRQAKPSIGIHNPASVAHGYHGAFQCAAPLIDDGTHDFGAPVEWPAVVLDFDIHAAWTRTWLAGRPAALDLHIRVQIVGRIEALIRPGAPDQVVADRE